MSKSGNGTGQGASFLEKLWTILNEPSNEPYIRWQPNGMSFLIMDVAEFEANVLTKYFKHSNHNSFVRQLNMYNFVKTCNDANFREFHNPEFQRGDKSLMVNIKRKASQPGPSKESLAKPPEVGMTQRQKAMIAQQKADEAMAAATRKRRESQPGGGSSSQSQSATARMAMHMYPPSLQMPSPSMHGNNVSWDPRTVDGTNFGAGVWGADGQQYGLLPGMAASPFELSMMRMSSTDTASSGDPLLLPGRRNPEGMGGEGEDPFAFNRLNSLDPGASSASGGNGNGGGGIVGVTGRPRSGSGSGSGSGSFSVRTRAGSGGQANDFGPVFEDTKNRVRELETRNFLLTEKFNALRSQYHQMMILMHTFFADTAAMEKEAAGLGSTSTSSIPKAEAGAGEVGLSRGGSSDSGGGNESIGLAIKVESSSSSSSSSSSGGGSSVASGSRSPRLLTPAALAAQALAILANEVSTSLSGGARGATVFGVGESDGEHSPAARALKATLGAHGSTASLGENIAERNTQDAVELIKSIRGLPPDARTTEGASNFVNLISSINRGSTSGGAGGSNLAGQPIVKQASLPASFAPPKIPTVSTTGNAGTTNSASPDTPAVAAVAAEAVAMASGMKRSRQEAVGDASALAGQPLKRLSSTVATKR